jgi:hypothetical protein
MAGTAVRIGGALHLENAGRLANTPDMGPVLEHERAFYRAHQAEWAALFPGRLVVVKGEELIGTYETMDLALAAGAARFGLDSFLVRKLGEAEQEVHVPALALGLLFAPSHGPTGGGSSSS